MNSVITPKKLLIGILSTLVGVAILFTVVTWINTVNHGYDLQTRLRPTYLNAQQSLNCLETVKVVAITADQQAEASRKLIAAATAARYHSDVPWATSIARGPMYAALVQANPDLQYNAVAYAQVVQTVNRCMTTFDGRQQALLSVLEEFDRFKASWTGRTFGSQFPTEELAAGVIGTKQRVHGLEAYELMYTLVGGKGAQDAYQTGRLEIPNPYPTLPVASPTPAG